MAIALAPDEEECYLLAILDSPDGLDLAEFAWHDPESDTGCYRAWDFQWPWYTCPDMYQVDQGARATGKTVSITMRAFALPFYYPGQKMLLTAPELNHLRPLTDAIETRLTSSRMTREMLPQGRSNGFTKTPHWQVKFNNSTQIISRLPNKDGKGVKGQHVLLIELDEAQDYPLAGWIEIVETLNRFMPGAMWRCHGVPKGVRDKFYEMTEGGDEDRKWTVHRPLAMQRPTWSPEERDEKIKEYGGSRQNIDYKRNIYGEHGDATNAVFVLAKLMDCVDKDEGSEYNTEVYRRVEILYERLPDLSDIEDDERRDFERQQAIINMIEIPPSHREGWSQKIGTKEVGSPRGYSAYYIGMDVGLTNHPSELLLWGQRQGSDHLDLLMRIHMQRIAAPDQRAVVEHMFQVFGDKLIAFALDGTGMGAPIYQELQRNYAIKDRVYGWGFSEKVVWDFENRELGPNETMEDLARYRNYVEATTDWLRNDYVDAKKMTLPYDRELLLEFQGQTYTVVRDTGDPYGKRRLFSGGSFHTLDAAKITMAAKYLPGLYELLNTAPAQEAVLDQFVGGY